MISAAGFRLKNVSVVSPVSPFWGSLMNLRKFRTDTVNVRRAQVLSHNLLPWHAGPPLLGASLHDRG